MRPHQPLPIATDQGHPADPCIMVIFGAAGDLTKRKLVPALYHLAQSKLLPEQFSVVGVSKETISEDEFRQLAGQHVKEFVDEQIDTQLWDKIASRIHYLSGDFKDPQAYQHLKEVLGHVNGETQTHGNFLFYLATPPQFFAEIVRQLDGAGLARETGQGWRRVVIEKPFGHDLESAQELNRDMGAVLKETQIYRIDHYLGKETVQNMMVFRFANGIFEPIWNRNYVDHVQITCAESIGIEQRGGYYEGAGALRDMVQNHLFTVLSLMTMEPPASLSPEAVRNEKLNVLQAINPITPEEVLSEVVRGQYGEGMVDNQHAVAYRSEAQVAPNSNVETFVALKLQLDNWRWAGVPIYLRTGKRMAERVTEVAIKFKRAPCQVFRSTPAEHLKSNWLIMRIQPEESISLEIGAKIPGPVIDVGSVDMDFEYADYFGTAPSTGYETLLYDCMIGDQTLFQRADTVEAGWSVVAPILDVWKALPPRDFANYASGTWGPKAAEELLKRDGRQWREINM